MNKMVLDSSLHDDLIKLFAFFCLEIQKEYDIHPDLLKKLLNQQEFVSDCVFLHQQCHFEMTSQLKIHKERIQKAYEDSDHENPIQMNDGDLERCGQILKIHKNGYVHYCNLHKYLHPHSDLMTKKCYGIDHIFTIKSHEQIIKERDYQSVHIIYQNHINKLYNLIRHLFYYNINKNCEILPIQINDKNVNDLLIQMTDDKTLFKGKILHEHFIFNEDHKTDKKLSYYYVKFYKYKCLN